MEAIFNSWVSGFPGSYVPLLARAVFFEHLGWESRGYAWARETSEEQLDGMSNYFERSERDIREALALKPNLMVAYCLLMRMGRANGDHRLEQIALRKAIDLCPYSLAPRAQYMVYLTPRWGGNHYAMDRFAQDAEKYVGVNPRLAALRGYISWDKGRSLEAEGNLVGALQLYTEALHCGPGLSFFIQRGRLFRKLKRYDDALADIRAGLDVDRFDTELLKNLVEVECEMGADHEALQTLSLLIRIDPNGSDAASAKSWSAGNLVVQAFKLYKGKDYEAALAMYNRAMMYNPEHAETFYYRASTHLALGRYNESLSDARRAIELDPHNLNFARYVDYVLVQQRRWDEIISMWNRFIELEPVNAAAYLERCGASFHKGDLQAALRDAEMACKLGNREGCETVNMIRQRGVH
jgi:tetratricopeptide (TPR) repeat protein